MVLFSNVVLYWRWTKLFLYLCSFGGGGGGSRGSGRGGFGGGSFRGGGGGGGFGGKKDKLNNSPGQHLRKPKWDLDALPKFKKDFYREHPNVQNRSMVRMIPNFSLIYFDSVS